MIRIAWTLMTLLLALLALYLLKNNLFSTDLNFKIAAIVMCIFCSILCFAYLHYAKKKTSIALSGSLLRIQNPSMFVTNLEIDCREIWRVRRLKKLSIDCLRLDILGKGMYVFSGIDFDEVDALDVISFEVGKFTRVNKPNFPIPYAGISIACVIIFIYLINYNSPEIEISFDLISKGAWVSELFLSGEYYRIFAYTFLHLNAAHLAFNVVLVIFLGLLIEHLLDRAQYFGLFFLSAMAGGFGGLFDSNLVLVGASGGIYGLIGAYAWIRIFSPNEKAERFYWLNNRTLLVMLVMDLFFGIFVEAIAVSVHIFGFVTGFLYMKFVRTRIFEWRTQCVLSIGSILVFAMGSLWTLNANSNWTEKQSYKIAKQFVIEPGSNIRTINTGAWKIGISEIDDVGTQLDSIDKLVYSPQEQVLDTLATLYARIGNFEEAIRIENSLVVDSSEIAYLSQLSRFELASVRNGDPLEMPLEELDSHRPAYADVLCMQANDKNVFVRKMITDQDQIANLCKGKLELIALRESGGKLKNINHRVIDNNYFYLPIYSK